MEVDHIESIKDIYSRTEMTVLPNKSNRAIKIPTALLLLLVLIAGCKPIDNVAKTVPPPAYSLLSLTPIVSDTGESQAVVPTPERHQIGNSFVNSWRIPYETPVLRLPVELPDSAHLSFRIGVKTRISIHVGDLVLRVEYIPETLPPGPVEENPEQSVEIGKPFTVWQATPVDTPKMFGEWYSVDMSLDMFSPGKGELRFIAEGPLAGNPGLDILFGQPAVYSPGKARGKNIILIGVDTLRRDSLSPYGADPRITPNLTKLSESGVLFEQARSQAPWTLPSFASMVTGRLPSEIGSTIYTGYLPDKNATISEYLIENGYTTATVCANTWIGNEQSGFQQGVEDLWYKYDSKAEESVEVVKEFIARSSGRDWFCFLHLMDPHIPYAPPKEYIDLLCDPAYDGEIGDVFGAIEGWKSGEVIPEEKDLQKAHDLYNGEVASLDKALGGLFGYLIENNLMDSTLVIFASDHGEEFFDHGGYEHGHTQYDELVHMPLIIAGPGFSGGNRIDDSIGNTDIVPTIYTFIGLPLPDDLAGVPLQDVMAGKIENNRFTYGEDNSRGTHRKYCVQWPYKCILDFVAGEILLYDLDKDPGETVNIYEDKRDIAETLAKVITLRMRPEESTFHVWITRSYKEPPQKFEGTITLPGGYKSVDGYMLVKGDVYALQGNSVSFNISSSTELLGPNKHLVIVPNNDSNELEASICVNGTVQPDRFFPYGNRDAEQSGHATVSLDDFTAGPNLPLAIEEYPAACYIWGVKGFAQDTSSIELDEESKAALRAIGYFSD